MRDESRSSQSRAARTSGLLLGLLACTIVLSGCGGSSSSNTQLIPQNLSGNWQFTMSPPTNGSFVGGLEGAYLSQNKNGSVSGAATYSVSLTSFSIPCNTGSATISGTLNGQTVSLSAVAGKQTFTLTGTLSLDGSTMTGNYDATAGQASDGSPCGSGQTGLEWSAILVPPLSGAVQGIFQSGGGAAGLSGQAFALSGSLLQEGNSGGSSSVVTGSLTFLNPITNASPYPCFSSAEVYGQISGISVSLEILGPGQSEWGLIGESVGPLGNTGLSPVTLNSVPGGGYALEADGAAYLVATTACPGGLGAISTSGDYGSICLAFGSTTACQPPIVLTPSGLSFSSQSVGGLPVSQTLTLANTSNSILTGVTLSLLNESGAANFTETDLCGPGGVASEGEPFNFNPGQTCTVTVTFAPQETCAVGAPPAECPSTLTARLLIAVPSSSTIMTAPITGTATSAHAVSTPQFDFGVENALEASAHKSLIFPGLSGTFAANTDRRKPWQFGCEASCRD